MYIFSFAIREDRDGLTGYVPADIIAETEEEARNSLQKIWPESDTQYIKLESIESVDAILIRKPSYISNAEEDAE